MSYALSERSHRACCPDVSVCCGGGFSLWVHVHGATDECHRKEKLCEESVVDMKTKHFDETGDLQNKISKQTERIRALEAALEKCGVDPGWVLPWNSFCALLVACTVVETGATPWLNRIPLQCLCCLLGNSARTRMTEALFCSVLTLSESPSTPRN